MKHKLGSRRFMIALTAILCLTAIGLVKGLDVSLAISSVAIAIAGAGAFETHSDNKREKKDGKQQ